jgi:Ca2+-binding EF-hand superfamily protein
MLKNRFKEADSDSDEAVNSTEFRKLLEKFSPDKLSDEVFERIYRGLEIPKGKHITFKQYLYGVYLFVTEDKKVH